MSRPRISCVRLLLGTGWALAILPPAPALAVEGGASVYLLGSGGPGAAVLPPLEGVYLNNTTYYYDGSLSARRDFVIGGRVVAGIDAAIPADFATVLWVPTTDLAGGVLALGGGLPVAAPMVDVGVTLSGPRGQQIDVSRHDSTMKVGDPLAIASLGWRSGSLHVTVSSVVNIPVGSYREGQVANIAFHRWAADFSLAGSWHDEEAGWDVSGKMGVTINGTNKFTDYDSGNDFHLEASVERELTKSFSAGVLGYYYNQISDDRGPGARLGGFQGEVAALGGTVAFKTILGRSPSAFRLTVMQEFNATNRMKGTSVMLSLGLPLTMKMPARAEP